MKRAVFPFWHGAWGRLTTALDQLAGKTMIRVGVACLLALLHVGLFAKAGHDRLDLPFNSHSERAPYYSDPDAQDLGAFPRQPHFWSRLLVSRWDAQHYIGTSIRGLTACPATGDDDIANVQCGLGWMPAHGMLAGAISAVTHLPDDITLFMIAVLATIGLNLLWTCRTLVDRFGALPMYGALVAFNLFPTAFFLVTPYPESTNMLLVLGGFVLLLRERWLYAALAIGAATAQHLSMLVFAGAFVVAALTSAFAAREEDNPRWWRPLVAIPVAVWGQLVTMIWLQIAVGSGVAHLRARDAMGDPHATGRVADTTFYLKGITSQHLDGVVLVATIAILALTYKRVVAVLSKPQLRFVVVGSIAMMVWGIATVHEYWGINRYLLMCPLTFLGLGVMARDHKLLFVGWIVLSVGMYWHVELCSYLSHGNPEICPCLGRFEYGMPFGS